MAKRNAALAEAGATIYEVSADEHLRQQLEAREDAIRRERSMLRRLENAEKERDAAYARIAELEKQLADKEADKKA